METILNFCLNVLINIEYYAKKIILAFIINILGIIMFFYLKELPIDIKAALNYAIKYCWTYLLTYLLVINNDDIFCPSSGVLKKVGLICFYISANCGYFIMIYHWDSICSFFHNVFSFFFQFDAEWIGDTLNRVNESVEALF